MTENKPSLLIKLLRWLAGVVEQIAQTGQETPCAMGYIEWARDVGPITFLYNGCCELGETEVQVFGHAVFHTYSDVYGEFGASLPGLRVTYEPYTEDPGEYEPREPIFDSPPF